MNQNSFQPMIPTAPPAPSENDVVLDFGKIFKILRNGWWIIASGGFGGALLAAVVVLQMEPIFSARAQILMGQPSRTGNVLGALVQDLNLDDDAIAGEIAIITSGRVLSVVSADLDLSSRPEFNAELLPAAPEPTMPQRLLNLAVDRLKLLLGAPAPMSVAQDEFDPALNPIEMAAQIGKESLGDQGDYVRQLMSSLRVRQVGNTDLVDVRFVSTDRMLAAAIPNAVVDVYIEDQLNRKFDALRRLTEGLETRLANMRGRLDASEQAVIDFRNQNLEDGFAEQTRLDQQISDLSRRLNQAIAEQAEIESQIGGLDAIISDRGPVEAAGLFKSALIEDMRSQIVELRQRADVLSSRSAPDSSQVQSIEDEILRLETMIAGEVVRLRDDRANQVELGAARVAALRAELGKLETRAIGQAGRQVQLNQLERNLAAANAVYGTFLDKFTETSEALDLQEGDAQIIAYAEPPSAPVAPDKKLAVALGGIGGGFAGMGLVFLLALLDSRIRSIAQLKALMPNVQVTPLPRVGGFSLVRPDPLVIAESAPDGPFIEGIRTLRSQLMLSNKSKTGRVVAVVSTSAESDKTATSLLLARSIAQMSISCVLVDADLRRTDLEKRLDMPVQPDLVDVLAGKASLEDALRPDPKSTVRILTSREGVMDPAGPLLSQAMEELLRNLRETFQVVIIDTTPLIPVSDAAPMIRLADSVLMLVRYGSHRMEVSAGLDILNRLAPAQISIVLSMAPRRSQKALDA